MSDYTIFKTDDIDLAAFLEACGHSAAVGRGLNQPLATFSFRRDAALIQQIEKYLSGDATINVRNILESRRRLFRSVRSLQGGGS